VSEGKVSQEKANQGQPKPSARRKARRFAMQALYQWHMTGTALGEIEVQFRTENDMRKTDVEYFHDVLHGVGKEAGDLDEIFAPLLDRAVNDLDPIEHAILRLSVYELQHRIDVPYKVVINEGVELAKSFGATDGHKYINGILDKLAPKFREAEVNAVSRR